ncbi:MAG: hypothetical protein QW134_05765, partial [Nitrososphaeria archaeon]
MRAAPSAWLHFESANGKSPQCFTGRVFGTVAEEFDRGNESGARVFAKGIAEDITGFIMLILFP